MTSSFFEIAGDIFELEHTSLPSSSLGGIAAERPERGRNSAKAESVRRALGSNETGESRPGLIGHYFRTLWFGGTEPTRRVFDDPYLLIPVRKNPYGLVGVMYDITSEGLEKQYEYFSGGNPW